MTLPLLQTPLLEAASRWAEEHPERARPPRRGRRRKKVKVAPPTAEEIAQAVVAKLKPAVDAQFVTEANAEMICGQSFDWVVSVARRIGVPVANPTGKKRIVDLSAFRAALAALAARESPVAERCEAPDSVETCARV